MTPRPDELIQIMFEVLVGVLVVYVILTAWIAPAIHGAIKLVQAAIGG